METAIMGVMSSMMNRYLSLFAAIAAVALSSCGTPSAEISKAPGAAFGSYEFVFVSVDDAWVANHVVIEVLQQELQRRGYAIKIGDPTPELAARSMTLKIDHAGATKKTNKGSLQMLKYLRFRLLDSPSGNQLASVEYDEDTLDRIGQKTLMADIADELFGSP